MAIKPVYLMHDGGITMPLFGAAVEAVSELLSLAGVSDEIGIHNFGIWRQPNYLDGNHLRPYQSLQWYLEEAQLAGSDRINADRLIGLLTFEPWRQQRDHYDLMLVSEDLYSAGCNFVIGLAREGIGTVVSPRRFAGLDPLLRIEAFKTAVMHEFGHVLGLPNSSRGEGLAESLGHHCTNRCVMRQGLRVPRDWMEFTNDRLNLAEPICDLCLRDLRQYFGR